MRKLEAASSQPQARRRPFALRRPIFYGWWLVGATLILTVLSGGLYIQGFSAYIVPLTHEFNVNRGVISSVLGFAAIGDAVLGPLQGMLVDRYGPRRLMLVGITLGGLGFFLISLAHSVVLYFLFLIPFVSMGLGSATFSPAMATVANWFYRHRGVAFALATTGFGLGGLIVPMVQLFISSFGWRGAAVASGIIVWAVGYPLALMMRHRPEQYGLYPDGASEPPPPLTVSGRSMTGEADFTVKETMATRAFWLVGLSFALRMFIVGSVNIHFIPIMEDKGFSASTGAALLSLFAIMTLPSRLAIGWLADRVPKHLIGAALGAVFALAAGLLVMGSALWQVYLFVILYAIAWGGGGASLVAALRGEYFGRRNFATISGLGSALMLPGTVGGPIFTGFSFDRTGSYDLALYVFIGAGLASMLMMLPARRPAPKRRAG